MAETTNPLVPEQVSTFVQRAIDRNIKGLEYLRSSSPQIGVSAKDVVRENGTMRLYHYHPLADEIFRVPILLVMATTNRGSIFDLSKGQSLVEFLLRSGYDVYMLDWEAPQPHERTLELSDYVDRFIPDCIEVIGKRSGQPDVTLIGYCMGGVLSLIYQSLNPDGPVRNLVTFTTPVDFTQMGLFTTFMAKEHFAVDLLVDSLGNIPSDMIYGGFSLQKPTSRSAAQLRLWDNMWNDQFVEGFRKFDRWTVDMLPLAGEYFRDTVRKLIWDNGLMTGNLTVKGRVADIGSIKVPFLHAVAQHDDLVPFEASHPLIDRVSSKDKREIVLKGGHVSLIAGPNAVKRLWPELDAWLQEKSV